MLQKAVWKNTMQNLPPLLLLPYITHHPPSISASRQAKAATEEMCGFSAKLMPHSNQFSWLKRRQEPCGYNSSSQRLHSNAFMAPDVISVKKAADIYLPLVKYLLQIWLWCVCRFLIPLDIISPKLSVRSWCVCAICHYKVDNRNSLQVVGLSAGFSTI